MKVIIYIFCILFCSSFIYSQENNFGTFNPSEIFPYGLPNTQTGEQIKDFNEMIGICDCRSVRRKPDQTWQDTLNMVWKFKYILNGNAVQDETWHENGFFATSIRQFQPDSLNWIVSYYGTKFIPPSVRVWKGNRIGNEIVLKMPPKSPGGLDGINRLTYYDISNSGFKWKGEWTDLEEKNVYPFWTIDSKRRN